MVALYPVIGALRTQGMVRRTTCFTCIIRSANWPFACSGADLVELSKAAASASINNLGIKCTSSPMIYGDRPRVSKIVRGRHLNFAGHCTRCQNKPVSLLGLVTRNMYPGATESDIP